MIKTCKNCRWYDKNHKRLSVLKTKNLIDEDLVGDCFGYCRKHKPLVFGTDKKIVFYGSWPIVNEKDFCGEFRKEED